jgi:uncharacterized protein YerC
LRELSEHQAGELGRRKVTTLGKALNYRLEAMQRLADGEVQADLARSYGMSQSTISRLSGDRPFEAGAAAAQ